MSVFVAGMKCRLCGEPITGEQKRRMFPPFVSNELDDLYVFHDGVFHDACFTNHPLASLAIRWSEEAKRKSTSDQRLSSISGMPITDMNDYLPLGFLTSDQSNPLYEFNFTQFTKTELSDWHRLDDLVHLLSHQRTEGVIAGRGIEWLISQLKHVQEKSHS